MDKNDILDYVTETPGNTNRAVLGSMLDSFADGGGGGGNPLVVTVTDGVMDKTWNEIKSAYPNVVVSITASRQGTTVQGLTVPSRILNFGGQSYAVGILDDSYFTGDPDGYPEAQ